MRPLLPVALLACSVAAADPDVASVIETRAIVSAPVEKVWEAFATSAGLESWMAGLARIDARPGGEMLTRYAKDGTLGDDATIAHTVLVADPLHLLALKPLRPPRTFPFKQAWLKTQNLLYFRALPDGRTEVLERMIGYDATDESQKMRAFFVRGNQVTMEALQQHFRR